MADALVQVGKGLLKSLAKGKEDDDEGGDDEETPLLSPKKRNGNGSTFTEPDTPVDFVLAWKSTDDTSENKEKREFYENHLADDGLKLTVVPPMGEHNFVLINAPLDVLERYCEILRLKMPIKERKMNKRGGDTSKLERKKSAWRQYLETFIDVDNDGSEQQQIYTAEFCRERRYLFDTQAPNFFTMSTRNLIVANILEQHTYGPDNSARGINRLVEEGVYCAAYPLHDGNFNDKKTMRGDLLVNWASVNKIFTPQPIDTIRAYFGSKYALYFAWLGYYTTMLVPASVVGILCFIYGLSTLSSDPISQETCASDAVMCPLCDKTCDYWMLSSTCYYSKIQHLFDNEATVFFAIFMSFWSTVFLELWKRYRSTLTCRWGLASLDLTSEMPRSQFLSVLRKRKIKKKLNPITNIEEPVVPFWSIRLPNAVISYSFFALLVLAGLIGVVATIIYRLSSTASTYVLDDNQSGSQGAFSAPFIASVINFLFIELLGKVYDPAATYLTDLELHRTETEYENALVVKTYCLQFVNTYAALFYIALVKGNFVGRPGDYNRVFGYRQEECAAGGCLMELCMQLLVIMTGKQISNAITENVGPYMTRQSQIKLNTWGDLSPAAGKRFAEDYKLLDLGRRGLYGEYLEIVLQYGFVVIFVACFPLAPLFALLNNAVEIRTDGRKLLKYYRRPVPERVSNIGAWFSILETLNHIAVLSNAFIIAFTSNFIPKLVYYSIAPANNTGFVDFTLSYFNTSDFENISAPVNASFNPEICRYTDYRDPPGSSHEYSENIIFWHVMVARLAFIVVFQNVVSTVSTALDWAIPDVSNEVLDELKEEAYVTNEIIVNVERQMSKTIAGGSGVAGASVSVEGEEPPNDTKKDL